MMATPISPARGSAARLRGGLALFLLVVGCHGAAGTPAGGESRHAARAEKLYQETRQRYVTGSNLVAIAWEHGRACFDRAEFARDDRERARLAEEGIAACRQAIGRDPRSAAGHYYLGMNLGQLARTKSLGALKLVREMEQEFKRARELDERFDHGGADRNLGLLYLEAPGWPASIGSKGKAQRHLRRAVELFPDYPGNRLCWCEALVKWGETEELGREARVVPGVMRQARSRLTGEAWEQSWEEWEEKWRRIEAEIPRRDREQP
jgi:tetratricopeptide (TPR) repeat protein